MDLLRYTGYADASGKFPTDASWEMLSKRLNWQKEPIFSIERTLLVKKLWNPSHLATGVPRFETSCHFFFVAAKDECIPGNKDKHNCPPGTSCPHGFVKDGDGCDTCECGT